MTTYERPQVDAATTNTEKVDIVLAALRQDVRSWNIKSLACLVECSERQLAYLFEQFVGRSPGEYIRLLRLSIAERLLRTTSESARDIAAEVGYISYPSFINSFRKVYGVPPGEYRKINDQQMQKPGNGAFE